MNSPVRSAPGPDYRTILVPLAPPRFGDAAMGTAGALAERFGATLHTVSVVPSDLNIDRARARGARVLGTDPDDPRIQVEVDTDVASAVERRAASLDACLICLATHARGRFAGTILGSTTRDIIDRVHQPVVVVGPLAADTDASASLREVDHLVACVDGTRSSESGLAIAAAWARTLGMKLTIVTVAEPCPAPVRIGAPWRRHHGPNEDADVYVRRLGDAWAFEAPGLDTAVVYDPVGAGSGMRDYLGDHPTGLVAVTSRLHERLPHLAHGSGAGDIVHASTAPVLVIPAGPVAT